MCFLGLDIGSLTCDAVLVDDSGSIVSFAVVPTGARNAESIARAHAEALQRAGIEAAAVRATVATGYGRKRVANATAAVTEITCHARGIRALLPDTEVLVDIGGQDSKAIRIGADGQVLQFAMNDKCAAGTGRFLEAMARALDVDVAQLSDLDRGAASHLSLSSMCTVFAESEVVSLIAEGTDVSEIACGLHRAIATRTQALVTRVEPAAASKRVAMSGGVARNAGVVRALGAALDCKIAVPEHPDIVGALGAALIARQRAG